MRSHRDTLAGRAMTSSLGAIPRAGEAEGMITSWAPRSAATVGGRECQASSQIRMAALPHRVAKTPTSWPASTNRSSSSTP